MLEQTKAAYNEILGTVKKHKGTVNIDIERLEHIASIHLFGLELRETHGLNVDVKQVYATDWVKLGEYTSIGIWGATHNRTISWSDDGRQPEDEYLLQISFPSGPYVFGESYPVELFQKFFSTLKGFNPDYLDTANKNLYWKLPNAKAVFNAFDDILKEYKGIYQQEAKKRQIEKLKHELEKLEG